MITTARPQRLLAKDLGVSSKAISTADCPQLVRYFVSAAQATDVSMKRSGSIGICHVVTPAVRCPRVAVKIRRPIFLSSRDAIPQDMAQMVRVRRESQSLNRGVTFVALSRSLAFE